jgi:hypothetical protein
MTRTFRNALIAALAVLFILYTATTIHIAYVSVEVDELEKEYEANRDRLARQHMLDVLRKMQGAADAAIEKTLAEVPGRRIGYYAVGEASPGSAGYPHAVLRRTYQLDGALPAKPTKSLRSRLAEATEPVAYFNCRFTNMTNRDRLDGGVYEEDEPHRRMQELGQFWYVARRMEIEPEGGEVRLGVFLASGRLSSSRVQELADEALFAGSAKTE